VPIKANKLIISNLKMMLKNKILILLIGIVFISKSFAQSSPKQLGKEFFNALKSNDSEDLMETIPEAKTIIKFSEHIGIEKNEEEITEFLKKYPNEVKQFINRCEQLKNFGIKLGIKWEHTKFKEVEINTREQQINETRKTIPITNLNIIFTYQTKSYRLLLGPVFEHNKVWFLGGDKPKLEKY
jgi:predicted TIM-barrel fold metal-dependent hydrolase